MKEGETEAVRMTEVEAELEEIERKMNDLEKDREDRSKRIMDRRVLQVTTLQELGKFIIIFIIHGETGPISVRNILL